MKNDFGIKGFIPMSLLDWPGKVCSIVFLGVCNYRCPACHNHDLVLRPGTLPDHPLESILEHLASRERWIDGVTVSGGEPTLRKNLPELLRTLKAAGMRIKLDTNGSNPEMLERLIDSYLLDAVYVDVKAPLTAEEYSRVSGVPVNVSRIERSIQILRSSGIEAGFRTTVIPGLVEEPQIAQIRDHLGSVDRYIIQSFRNQDTLDPAFASIEEFRPERVERMRELFEVPSPRTRLNRYAFAG